jgi:hypothetical protein
VLPAASESPDAPDLRIALPSVRYTGQAAPVYVDAYERPGRLLYRFDALIQNTGGVLDVFGGRSEVRQKVWPGGEPTTAPEAGAPPPGPSQDRAATGATFDYVHEVTHEHWHFFSAARYSLLVPGEPARVSDKVGFCMFDSFGIEGGATTWFAEDGSAGWCRPGQPGSTFVRMGLSRGASDRYSSQREFQFVDVTGLAPGPYTLRAEANPGGQLIDADPGDDVHEERREIPGVVADGTALSAVAGAAGSVEVSARAVAPEVPARRSASCVPRATLESCYLRIAADTPLSYVVAGPPAYGAASFDGARLTYLPDAGFTGADSLTYVATDGRGLRSAPATVTIEVAPARPRQNGRRSTRRRCCAGCCASTAPAGPAHAASPCGCAASTRPRAAARACSRRGSRAAAPVARARRARRPPPHRHICTCAAPRRGASSGSARRASATPSAPRATPAAPPARAESGVVQPEAEQLPVRAPR